MNYPKRNETKSTNKPKAKQTATDSVFTDWKLSHQWHKAIDFQMHSVKPTNKKQNVYIQRNNCLAISIYHKRMQCWQYYGAMQMYAIQE